MKAGRAQALDESVGAIIEAAVRTLTAAGVESARLDSEVLLAAATGSSRESVMAAMAGLSVERTGRYGEFIARRAAREPLAYILGRKEFFSLEFEVGPAVLIPRPETEILVAAALEVAGGADCTLLDLGTGSGAIAVAIAANAPHARIVATDVSPPALEVARRNAIRLGVADRIQFRLGNLWQALVSLDSAPDGPIRFDLVVSNPPYIEGKELEALAPEIARFEPLLALSGGSDGLDFYRRICGRVGSFLRPGGELLVELGAGQAASVAALCRDAGCGEIALIEDLAGLERVLRARFG